MPESITFGTGTVQYHYKTRFTDLKDIVFKEHCVIVTDSTVASLYPELETMYPCIVIPSGEEHKKLKTINIIVEQLLEYKAHRKTVLLGIGGGVITDITGFAASIYMRGMRFGFVPTTLLGMVDASIGGKNGVNFGLQKNLVGTIQQPQFILFDTDFLSTLPSLEWSNGFAEIIKYACIFDDHMFETLQKHQLEYYHYNHPVLDTLIHKCAGWKNKTVQEDEQEKGLRKLLNFGHTAGHAIETLYNLSHGQAISLGMLLACKVSEAVTGLDSQVYYQLTKLMEQYKLPSALTLHPDKLMDILAMDKKRNGNEVDYIVLNKIGSASIQTIPFDIIRTAIENFPHAGNH